MKAVSDQRILNVNLTSGEMHIEPVPQEDIMRFLGGRGIAAKLLYERVKPETDPLGPDNPLIFSTGTLTGTSAPSSGRSSVTCKGPATGLYLKCSAGGHVGAELKYAGYDYLAISGAAENPVYLWIDDDKVEIRDASHLWGKGTRETDRLIKEGLSDPEIQVAAIGPAGENKVLFACIMCSLHNAAARGGVGAVMGSKLLKAIAVRGSGGIEVEHGQAFFDLSCQIRQEVAADPCTVSTATYGTSGSAPGLNEMYMLPAYNFRQGQVEGHERISGQYLVEAGYLTGRISCFGCGTACHRYVTSHSDEYGDVHDTGPELETMMSLGGECLMTETEALLKGNQLCNDLGLDTISAGTVIAWAMECYEKGLITPEQTDGLELEWGNMHAALTLIERIARREGFLGDLLADGTKRAADKVGGESWKWAIQAKGLEQSGVDTRATKSYALAFAVNPRGPDHLMTECFAEFGFTPEARALIKKICGDESYAGPHLVEKRADIVRWHEDCYAISEALGFCVFTSTAAFAVNPENMAQLFNLALDVEMSEEEIMLAGRRIVTVERCFNVREGATRQDDVLPWRMMNEPLDEGPNAGLATTREILDKMLDEYYTLHGWDVETGDPTSETLKYLGLVDICTDLL